MARKHLQSWRGRTPADRRKLHNGSVKQLSLHARQRCEHMHLDLCRCLNYLKHHTESQLGVLVRENPYVVRGALRSDMQEDWTGECYDMFR